jgi:Uma2 family endonuclease
MSTTASPMLPQDREIVYPETDGQPMAENTKQFRWIVTIQGGIDALFAENSQVFVAGDLFWYPVEGRPDIRTAPDVMVVFGRPKGDRRSYLQWREDGIAPQVVWEIISPGNSGPELARKVLFYERYGVEECYTYDPDTGELSGWKRSGEHLEVIPQMRGWISPRLTIRFEIENDELVLYRPDGSRFQTFQELQNRADAAEAEVARLRALLNEPNGT